MKQTIAFIDGGERRASTWILMTGTILLSFVACIFMSSCAGSQTIWSAEAKSPDGRVVATARAVLRNKRLSIISGIDTQVYLNWAGDRRPPMLILSLADGSDTPVDTSVEMKWLTPTHLEVAYKGNQTADFEAIKWANIDISVRSLVSEKIRTGALDLRDGKPNLQTPPVLAYQKTAPPQPSR